MCNINATELNVRLPTEWLFLHQPSTTNNTTNTTNNSTNNSIEEEITTLPCASDTVSASVASTAINAIRHLCLADCLDFYTIIPSILNEYEETAKKSKTRNKKHNDSNDNSFYLADDLVETVPVLVAVAQLMECGTEHYLLLTQEDDEDNFTNNKIKNVQTLTNKKKQIYQTTQRVINVLLLWCNHANIRVCTAAMNSLSVYGYCFPTNDIILSMTKHIKIEITKEKEITKLNTFSATHTNTCRDICLRQMSMSQNQTSTTMQNYTEEEQVHLKQLHCNALIALTTEIYRGEEEEKYGKKTSQNKNQLQNIKDDASRALRRRKILRERQKRKENETTNQTKNNKKDNNVSEMKMDTLKNNATKVVLSFQHVLLKKEELPKSISGCFPKLDSKWWSRSTTSDIMAPCLLTSGSTKYLISSVIEDLTTVSPSLYLFLSIPSMW